MSLRTFKLTLAVIVGCFILSATYISYLIIERQNALQEVSRYNTAWLASQAVSEFTRLQQSISAFGLLDPGSGKEDIELRVSILLNRAKLFTSGEFQVFVEQDPEREETVRALNEALASVKPILNRIEQPGAVQQALSLLKPINTRLSGLASAANRYGADRVAEDQHELVRLHWLFSALAGGLIVLGIILIGFLGWHNRLLERAHRELHKREIELRSQNERFDAALNNMSHGICMVDESGQVIVFNARFAQLFSLPAKSRPGSTLSELVTQADDGTQQDGTVLQRILAEQQEFRRSQRAFSFTQAQPNGQVLAVSHQPMVSGGWVATYEDITDRRRTESQIAYMAHHDALTDLANRVLFHEKLEEALANTPVAGPHVAVLCLDLDRFKDVNDTLGHQTGDDLLKLVADRLKHCIRGCDIVARLGGDEFAILQLDVNEPSDCAVLAARIVAAIGAPFDLHGHEIVIGASIGIALSCDNSADPHQLLKYADLALYCAKADGRGTFRFFEPEMDIRLQAQRVLEADLRAAWMNKEFELFYQPQVNLKSEELSGYEALLRWHHPERGLVPPGEFIPAAEDMGLIVPLGEWIIQQACLEAVTWPNDIKVAVNLSPVQFRSKTLVQSVQNALENSGLSPMRLELEITESVLLQDNEATLTTLYQLRQMGVRIALDDFGTGYSALSYLRSFPFDKIKIDQSFVRELSSRSDCLAIVQSIATLGATLGMATTAEGVETESQLIQLREAGCTEVQGYYFGRPKPACELDHSLSASQGIQEVA